MGKLNVYKIITTIYAEDEEEAWEIWDDERKDDFGLELDIMLDGEVYVCGICNEEIPEHEHEAYGGWCAVCTELHRRGEA